MQPQKPLVSVVMPVYNAEKYVAEAIESVLAQTYINFEFLIFNDGSKDSSAAIVQHYARQDNRIKFFNYTENTGYLKHLNEGITQAQGSYIARMDADDICLPQRFEKQVAYMETNPTIGVCGTWYTVFKETVENKMMTVEQPEEDSQIKVNFLNHCSLGHPTVMARTALLKKNKYDQNFYPAEDYELWTRLIAKTSFHNLPEVLLLYRWHGANISATKSHAQQANGLKSQINLLTVIGLPHSQYTIKTLQTLLPLHQTHSLNIAPTAQESLERLQFLTLLHQANLQSKVLEQKLLQNYMQPIGKSCATFELVNYQPRLLIYYFKAPFPTFSLHSLKENCIFVFKCLLHWKTRV